MRYLFYKEIAGRKHDTVIILDDSDRATTFPDRGRTYSTYKSDWLDFYNRKRNNSSQILRDDNILTFEICENQFNKFKEQGIIPINWDY